VDVFPTLAILRVGNNPDDISYEKSIIKNCHAIGIKVLVYKYPLKITMASFVKALAEINQDNNIHGILIFRPLPKQIDEKVINNMIHVNKDIDCMHPLNLMRVFEGELDGFLPCTPAAVMEILKYFHIEIAGKHAVIIGRSMVVGKPLSMMLLKNNATVTMCHSRTRHIEDIASTGDILVAAIGKAKAIGKAYVKPCATIIDVGINVDEKGNVCGDVDTEDVAPIARRITPVPAGVGAVTTMILLEHVIKAAEMTLEKE
jgi:methylenetetrahydrofolate dehydrogenase (NADP+)/methenyltetrahydrofolate cyclohydrolase